jgi:CheY-like chemotaxis protein
MLRSEQTPACHWHTTCPEGWGLMPSSEQSITRIRPVLVVEDDTLVSETIAVMLDGHYETVVAQTVEEALAHLGPLPLSDPEHRDKPLILLDCLLPGGRLAELLQAADQQSIPIVLMSGDPERATRIDAHRRFLPKPFSREKLLQALTAACG